MAAQSVETKYIDSLQKFKEDMIGGLLDEKAPWSSHTDRHKAWHIANIVFNSLLVKILPDEVEAWRKENNIILKETNNKKGKN